MTGVLAFLGWFFLALYAGIGLISLPYDLIQSFIHRPQYVKPDTCALRMSDIGKKTRELIELGTSMAKHREKGTLMAAEVKIGRSAGIFVFSLLECIVLNKLVNARMNECLSGCMND